MRHKHNMLLTGVAALALLAGGGIAAAQQSPQGQDGGASATMSGRSGTHAQSAKPSGGAGTGMEQHAQTGSQTSGSASSAGGSKSNPSMARQGSEKGKTENRSAETNQRQGKAQEHFGENAKGKSEPHERFGVNERSKQDRSSARDEHERNRRMSAQRNERNGGLKGLQGNTSIPMQGSHVNLTSDQRTHIRDTVIDARGAPRVDHVDFDVTVGTVVPRERVHVVRVPETLVRIDPQWRGYLYFIVEDQVVIVNPHDMRIVAVLDV